MAGEDREHNEESQERGKECEDCECISIASD
jgi:hypothetical protein